ncbi:MAG: hypothetical protein FD123_725 [Bacteroidetes bacterium]|nr:MAG: hypothetical protein FD123_725 [Bacteroidota bacterium]
MRKSKTVFFIFSLLVFAVVSAFSSCGDAEAQSKKTPGALPGDTVVPETKKTGKELLPDFLDSALCDGFDFPFGDGNGGGSYTSPDGKKFDGWYIATHTGENYSLGVHTGEDWNGRGGGDTDKGQPVYATASGKVIASADYGAPWGNVIVIEHRFLENGKLRKVHSLYAHLEKRLAEKGWFLKKRAQLGTIGTGGGAYPAHLHFEIRRENMLGYDVTYWPSSNNKDSKWVLDHYEKPSEFITQHRKMLVPATADTLLIAFKSNYRMYLCSKGKKLKEYAIALGQDPLGHKQKQGDNRTPEGEYRIIQKSLGPFSGDYAAFLGDAWMRINYPNNYDAKTGLKKGLITPAQQNAIVQANNAGKEPMKTTALGGGIGLHGWAGKWTDDGQQNLTWGCLSLNNDDLLDLYKRIGLQTVIIIHP